MKYIASGAMLALLSLSIHAGEPAPARQQELLHLLKQDCGSCHGLTLKGGLGPALLPPMLEGKPVDYLTATILDGHPGTAMPPWRGLLAENEARWLAEILREGVE